MDDVLASYNLPETINCRGLGYSDIELTFHSLTDDSICGIINERTGSFVVMHSPGYKFHLTVKLSGLKYTGSRATGPVYAAIYRHNSRSLFFYGEVQKCGDVYFLDIPYIHLPDDDYFILLNGIGKYYNGRIINSRPILHFSVWSPRDYERGNKSFFRYDNDTSKFILKTFNPSDEYRCIWYNSDFHVALNYVCRVSDDSVYIVSEAINFLRNDKYVIFLHQNGVPVYVLQILLYRHKVKFISATDIRIRHFGFYLEEIYGFNYQLRIWPPYYAAESLSYTETGYYDIEMSFRSRSDGSMSVLNAKKRYFISHDDNDLYFFTLKIRGWEGEIYHFNPLAYASVYRKNESVPIFSEPLYKGGRGDWGWLAREYKYQDKYDDDVYHYLHIPEFCLPPGDYFIVIEGMVTKCWPDEKKEENFPHYIHYFSVRKNGRFLNHPAFSYNLLGDRSVLLLKSEDGTLCFDDEYRLVGFGPFYRVLLNQVGSVDGDKLHFELPDLKNIPDDNNAIVLYHNNQPVSAYRYMPGVNEIHPLTDVELAHVVRMAELVKPLTSKYNFAFESGFTAIKDYVLDVLSGNQKHHNMMVYCEKKPSVEFMTAMQEILYGSRHFIMDADPDNHPSYDLPWVNKDGCLVYDLSGYLGNEDYMCDLENEFVYRDCSFYLFEQTSTLLQFVDDMIFSQEHFPEEYHIHIPYTPACDLVSKVELILLESMFTMSLSCMVDLDKLIIREADLFRQLDDAAINRWVNHTVIPYLNDKYLNSTDGLPACSEIIEVHIPFDEIQRPVLLTD